MYAHMCYFFLCLLLLGCSQPPSASNSDPIRVKSGKVFEVKLESQVATGYRWRLEQPLDSAYLQLVETRYEPAKKDVDGSVDAEIWVFKALRPGKTAIHLLYNPAWQEQAAADAKTRTVQVIIE